MRRALACAALTACGHGAGSSTATAPGGAHATPPTCEAIVAHLAVIFDQHDLAKGDRADLVASCERDQPPPSERVCMMAAESRADIDACGREAASAAHARAVAPPPADPREDLLALGGRVYTYLRQLGEAPPAAGPTPAIGACCAAACAADASQWTGPWQLVRFGLDHATAYAFAIEPGDGGTIVRAIGCTGAPSYELRITAGGPPAAADVRGGP